MILYKGGPDIPLREINTSIKYCNGSIHPTKQCGDIIIIGQEDRKYISNKAKITYPYFIVEFSDGTKVVISDSSIRQKSIKNPNQPSIHNIGFKGQGEHETYINRKHTKKYTLWLNMFQRCYSEKYHLRQLTYIGCTVDERWQNFQNFCADILYLKNYEEWKYLQSWELDKDIKVKGNRVYSKSTCQFTTPKENTARGNRKLPLLGLTFVGTRIVDNHTEEFTNQTEFAEKYHLCRSKIGACLLGYRKSSGGWTFKTKKEEK